MNNIKRVKQAAGFSLVELMIALTLGILVVGIIGFMFLQTKQSSRQNESSARLQENARSQGI